MIELVVFDYLKDKIDVPVYMEIPSNPPAEFVVVEKTSSAQLDFINNATFAIQSYSTKLYKTALLNEVVKNAMLGDGTNSYGIIELNDVSKCSLNSDYNYPDTQNKKYRYQAVFDLVY